MPPNCLDSVGSRAAPSAFRAPTSVHICSTQHKTQITTQHNKILIRSHTGKTIQAISLIVTHRQDKLPAELCNDAPQPPPQPSTPHQNSSRGGPAALPSLKDTQTNKEGAKPLRIALPHVRGRGEQGQQQGQGHASEQGGEQQKEQGQGQAAATAAEAHKKSGGAAKDGKAGTSGAANGEKEKAGSGATDKKAGSSGKEKAGKSGAAAASERNAVAGTSGAAVNAGNAAAAAAVDAPARKQRRAAQDRDYFLSTWGGQQGGQSSGAYDVSIIACDLLCDSRHY